MTEEIPRELREKGLITDEQFERIDAIASGKVISVFYELRSLLYLGVMLFSAGVGSLIYEHIGQVGHVISIFGLGLLTAGCFWYAFKHAVSYSNDSVKAPTPYFDYVVLLGSLLFITVQGYLQFQFGWLENNLGWSTLLTAFFFFVAAYRFDHTGVLSLAITALASFWSLQVSPQKWYSGNFLSEANLSITAIVFGSILTIVAAALNYKSIKKHFSFTYYNFSLLIFFGGTIAAMFLEKPYFLYVLLTYAGGGVAYFIARHLKSFLFLLYAFLAAYVSTTYLLAQTLFQGVTTWWFYYSIISCGGFVYFLLRYRNHFSSRP